MKVLLYGGGAREHAMAWKISSSPLLSKLYLSKPNDGFAELGEILEAENFTELAFKAKNENIDLLVVGPEKPLANGIVDEFRKHGIACIGPDKKWAMLESSKSFAKEFMVRNNIPTAGYFVLQDENQIENILNDVNYPVVIKADGLAAGKGVKIVNNKQEATESISEYLSGCFGEASKKVLVEEFLEGEEISLISIWDGKTLLPLIPARDYKRLLNDNQGPNTGGMGAYCPVHLTEEEKNSINNYVKTLENALLKEKADFAGIVYSGLMMTKQGLKVLEYNMRFGDPETQPLLTHLESDLLSVFVTATGKQLDKIELSWKSGTSMCLVIAANGYPYDPVKNGEIKNIEEIKEKFGVNVFFAGVKEENGKLLANGGRILSICKTDANEDVYSAAEELLFEDKYYRTDIGNLAGIKG